MMLAPPMMTASPNDVCLAAHLANIASLRNEVEQHHYAKHNIISPQAIHYLKNNRFYGIIAVMGGVAMKETSIFYRLLSTNTV